MRTLRAFVLLALLLLPLSSQAQQTPPDLDKLFSTANALLGQKKYAEALVEYRKILVVEPDLEGPLQNGAMAAFFAADYKTAKEFYLKLKANDSNSGFFRAKLVQVYQAMGDEKARDTERAELIALHNAGKDNSSIAKRKDFCREQYQFGKRRILVYEPFVFEPHGKDGWFAPRYQFLVTDEEDKLEVRVEVGWNIVAKNSQGIYKPEGKLSAFYFDGYYPAGRKTLGLFMEELSYPDVKKYIQTLLEGKAKPSSATTRKDN